MDEYTSRNPADRTELIEYLQRTPSRMYDLDSLRNSLDNCECPECPCCDPDMKWLWPVGAGVLAASTGILLAATAADVATGGD